MQHWENWFHGRRAPPGLGWGWPQKGLPESHSVRRQLLTLRWVSVQRALFTDRVHYESFLVLPLILLLSDGPGSVKHIAFKSATISAHRVKFTLLWFMLWNLGFLKWFNAVWNSPFQFSQVPLSCNVPFRHKGDLMFTKHIGNSLICWCACQRRLWEFLQKI